MVLMASFFCCKSNATIAFEVVTDAIVSDTGNFTVETKTIKVKAYMVAANGKLATQFERLAGVDGAAIMVQAFCVSPMVLPATVAEESIADCTFGSLKGKLYLHPLINPPIGRNSQQEARIGTRLIGWFQVSRSFL